MHQYNIKSTINEGIYINKSKFWYLIKNSINSEMERIRKKGEQVGIEKLKRIRNRGSAERPSVVASLLDAIDDAGPEMKNLVSSRREGRKGRVYCTARPTGAAPMDGPSRTATHDARTHTHTTHTHLGPKGPFRIDSTRHRRRHRIRYWLDAESMGGQRKEGGRGHGDPSNAHWRRPIHDVISDQ